MKTLEYESLKVVIQYFEANLRIQLAQRLPSIRNIEKLVPLKIERLEFKGLETIINDTTYKLGGYIKYDPGYQVPKSVQESNDAGGSGRDMENRVLTPGDLKLQTVHTLVQAPVDPVVQEANAARHLKISELALAKRKEWDIMEDVGQLVRDLLMTLEAPEVPNGQLLLTNHSPYEPIDYVLPQIPLVLNRRHQRYRELQNEIRNQNNQNIPAGPQENLEDDPDYKRLVTRPVEKLENIVENRKILLQKCHFQLHGIPLPYHKQLQLTVKSSTGLRRQLIPYEPATLPNWLKELNTKLFGYRSHPIQVQYFSISTFTTVLRLPLGLKLQAKNITIPGRHLTALTPIIVPKLDTLSLESAFARGMPEILQNPALQNTRKLVIHNYEQAREAWVPVLRELRNQCVELKSEGTNFPMDDFFGLVEDWMENGRPLGTVYSVEFRREKTGKDVLDMISNRVVTRRTGVRSLDLQMPNNLYLSVYYCRIPGEIQPLEDLFGRDYASRWVLKMRVKESDRDW